MEFNRSYSQRFASHFYARPRLQERGVTLLGGGLDEAPQAYKDIESVLAAQSDLVEVVARFMPRIVRMADEPGQV